MENKARLLSNDELVSLRAVSELHKILNSDSQLVLPVVFYHSKRLMYLCFLMCWIIRMFHRLQLQSDAAVIISNFEFIKNSRCPPKISVNNLLFLCRYGNEKNQFLEACILLD